MGLTVRRSQTVSMFSNALRRKCQTALYSRWLGHALLVTFRLSNRILQVRVTKLSVVEIVNWNSVDAILRHLFRVRTGGRAGIFEVFGCHRALSSEGFYDRKLDGLMSFF